MRIYKSFRVSAAEELPMCTRTHRAYTLRQYDKAQATTNGRLLIITIINCGLQQPTDDNPLALATSPFFPFVGKTTYRTPAQKSKTSYLLYSS